MKAETLFLQALEITDLDRRERFLEAAEASEEIKSETRQLLAADDQPDQFLAEPVGGEPTMSLAPIAEGPTPPVT